MDIHTIIAGHQPKPGEQKDSNQTAASKSKPASATFSDIPDIFFDEILINTKLSRIDINVLMFLYRRIWCKPNLYQVYGISPMLSITETAKALKISVDELYQAFKHLEGFGYLGTIRSGQYFVRKYISRENDEKYGHTYDDFEI
ncbi:MAG: hypothetical protein CME71_12205 [Halobacteriovorax sp.]|nr:hypothetical protein [Halobacteriovorax sp.]